MEFYTQKAEKAIEEFRSDAHAGLGEEQIRENAEKYGRNEFTKTKRKSLLRRIFEAATEPMLILLLFAWAITVAVNIVNVTQGEPFDWAECAGILVAVLISVVLTVLMEGRSAKAFEELNKIKEGVEIKVVRGGVVQYVPQQELVAGDIVFLETGNKVAADGRLIECVDLFADESSLTGESAPVQKDAAAVFPEKTPVAERANMVYSGTFITGGTGKMVVTGVGDSTQFGLIAREIQGEESGQTPLQEKMGRLGKTITLIGAVCAGLIFLIQFVYILAAGKPSFENISGAFISSIVLMVAAVPEGLPTIVAISLSINIARMARQNALVKKMVACETIGCINVICSDKTGTLTENRMTVVDVWSHGSYSEPEKQCDEAMLKNYCINSTADLYYEGESVRFVGNPTEGALLVSAGKCGVDYRRWREEADVAELFPFSSDTKNMTSCVRTEKGFTVYTKGSPEKILALCTGISAEEKKAIEEEIMGLQKRARRVLAFAHKDTAEKPVTREDAENGMTFDGFVGIADPLRKEVYAAVQSCKTAGIEVKMLTGDNIVTATAIADELGILDGEHIAVEASYLESLSDKEFSEVLPKVRVIARSTPLLKMRVVKELKSKGSVVAVTGDGINDAPALKNADVGIAMGISGTEVSKEAADIVLLNDSFSTIVTTVKWGRGIYENFKRFIQFQLTVNVASVLIVFLCTVIGMFVEGFRSPFSALDLLWINIIMDGPPALTLGLEPIRDDLMQRKPTARSESIVSRQMLFRIAVNGVFMCLVCLAQMGWNFLRLETAEVSTSVFTLFVIFQLFNAFNCRELGDKSIFPNIHRNKLMLGAFVIAFALQVLIVQFGGGVFGTVPMEALDWLKIIALALSVVVIDEVVKLIRRTAGKAARE